MTLNIESTSPKKTEDIARQIGEALKGGEVIELLSDIGAGKTTFVRGLVRGVGSNDDVASPTFTISRVYESPKLTVHHLDLYRLDEAGLVKYEIKELLHDPKNVIVIEWSDIAKDVLKDERLKIEMKTTGEHTRKLTLTYPKELAYLVKDL